MIAVSSVTGAEYDGAVPTLDKGAEDGTTPPLIGAPAGMGVNVAAGVRRLTPVECERLQALPDGWTDLGGTPDSRRYSALGDAVTAPVGRWIGHRLAAAGVYQEATE